MNYAKIAAALHALAEAFTEGAEAPADVAAPKKGSKKAAVAEAVAAVAQPAAPVVPSITKEQLNKAVLAVAAKSRDAAEAVLAKFGAKNTVTLPPEQWQAVFDAFEEELAKINAVSVQVAQASLV